MLLVLLVLQTYCCGWNGWSWFLKRFPAFGAAGAADMLLWLEVVVLVLECSAALMLLVLQTVAVAEGGSDMFSSFDAV